MGFQVQIQTESEKKEKGQTIHGVLHYWNLQRGYGVIRSAPGASGVWREFFIHASRIISGEPVVGCFAEFTVGARSPGRPRLSALDCKFSPKLELTESLIATLSGGGL